jgi:hypothetical protein
MRCEPAPPGPPGPAGPSGPAGSVAGVRLVRSPCDATNCTVQCETERSATCRGRGATNNSLIAVCAKSAGPMVAGAGGTRRLKVDLYQCPGCWGAHVSSVLGFSVPARPRFRYPPQPPRLNRVLVGMRPRFATNLPGPHFCAVGHAAPDKTAGASCSRLPSYARVFRADCH